MKKRELSALILEMLTKTLEELAGKTPHSQKYRKSWFHPDEAEKRARAKQAANNQSNQPRQSRFSGDFQDGDAEGYEFPPPIKDLMNSTLLNNFSGDPIARKILQGSPVGKKEADLIARRMMAIPYFPIQRIRKLTSLVMLLAIENQKQ